MNIVKITEPDGVFKRAWILDKLDRGLDSNDRIECGECKGRGEVECCGCGNSDFCCECGGEGWVKFEDSIWSQYDLKELSDKDREQLIAVLDPMFDQYYWDERERLEEALSQKVA